ncbi:MAG: O-antigen ligase family protein [Patescibacteria group bacterium]|nr:O-antigen ligase family protein [Patescibacteria group bacterium]
MKKIVEGTIKVLIYLTFFAPLVVLPSSYIFPFIVPKILLFRSLLELMAGGYVLLLIVNWREYKPKFTVLNFVMAAFLFSFAISTFAGADAYHSFWDNHERMLGLFTIIHYIIYYFICSAVLKNWKDWNLALKIFLVAGSLVMILGLVQIKDPYFLLNQGSPRISSTLGNPIYVGGYGLFLIFVSFLLFIKEKSKVWRAVEAAMCVLAFFGMLYSGTRGSLLGFFAGIGFLTFGYALILKNYPKIRKILWVIIAAVLLSLGTFYFYRQTNFVRDIPTLGPLLNTSIGGTVTTRFIAWNIAMESWKERPIFGWGPNNFFYAFNKYYNPKSLEFGYGETWFDNAHNIILNTLAVQGVFGVVVYLFIFIAAITVLWQNKELKQKNIHIVVAGSAFLVAHLIQNITVFENPTSYLYFMFWLAMINRFSFFELKPSEETEANKNKLQKEESINSDKNIGAGVLLFVCVSAVFFIFIFNIQPARANQKTFQTLNLLGTNLNMGLTAANDVLAFSSPHIDDIRIDIARSALQILNAYQNQISRAQAEEIFKIVYYPMKENITLHPLDIRNNLVLAQLLQIEAMVKNDAKLMVEARDLLMEALRFSPKRQQLLYTISSIEYQLGRWEESVAYLESAINDNPNISESYWRLAYAYQLMDKMDKAMEVVNLAKERNVIFEEKGQAIIDDIVAKSQKMKK